MIWLAAKGNLTPHIEERNFAGKDHVVVSVVEIATGICLSLLAYFQPGR